MKKLLTPNRTSQIAMTASLNVFLSSWLLLVTIAGPSLAQFNGLYIGRNLSLTIIIKYPEQQLTDRNLTDDLFLVGNGLGLLWEIPRKLDRVGTDTWQMNFLLKATPDGHSCEECSSNDTLPLRQKFEYRVQTFDGYDMIGANYGTELPVSKMSYYFKTSPVRYHYPHFFTLEGSTAGIDVESSDELIATRRWGYYLPPSYAENPYKRYPVFLILDLGEQWMQLLSPFLDDMTVKYALTEESIYIGSEDFRPLLNAIDDTDRVTLLTPSEGTGWFCYNDGDLFIDGCHGCVPANVTDTRERYQVFLNNSCGYSASSISKGEEYLDYWLNQVLPAVNETTLGRILNGRYDTVIGGCSVGGLLSCHALWTRPESFSAAACQSSSFWWPTTHLGDNGFHFLNVTLKNNTGPRQPQRVYIDVTDLEDSLYTAQLGAALQVADAMVAGSPQFVWDETLTLAVINGQVHGSLECLSRLWMHIGKLVPTQGGPRNPVSGSITWSNKSSLPETPVRKRRMSEEYGNSENYRILKDWSKDHFNRMQG